MISNISKLYNNDNSFGNRAGQMAQWFALLLLQRTVVCCPAPSVDGSQIPVTPAPGNRILPSDFCGHLYGHKCMFTCVLVHMCTQTYP